MDEFEQELEEQLKALDEQADNVSKSIEAESSQNPEDTNAEPEVKEPEQDDSEAEDNTGEADSKGDEGDIPSKTAEGTPEPDEHPVVPVARLSEATRRARKLERENREKDDQIAKLQETLDGVQAQAKARGVDLDESTGFTEDKRETLTDEFGAEMAATLIGLQKQADTAMQLARQATSKQQNPDDDPLMEAIVNNDDAHSWFLANGKQWQAMKDAYAENETSLISDFKTDEERIEHVVKLVKAQSAPKAKSKEPSGPARSLSDVPGDKGTTGSRVDDVLAMGDRATDYMEKLEFETRFFMSRFLKR